MIQAVTRGIYILFLTQDRLYLADGINGGAWSRNGLRRELLVQLLNALFPIIIAFFKDLKRHRIRMLMGTYQKNQNSLSRYNTL